MPNTSAGAPDFFPSTADIVAFVRASAVPLKRKAIARAFGIKTTEDKQRLKELLRTLYDDGTLEPIAAPEVEPVKEQSLIGVYKALPDGAGHFFAAQRRDGKPYFVLPPAVVPNGALVEAHIVATGKHDKIFVRIARVLNANAQAPYIATQITMLEYDLHESFDSAAEAEAAAMPFPTLHDREDMRHLPFVVIDPVDARDHDDAVHAQPHPSGHGYLLYVAISDVSAYVTPNSAIDAAARQSATSVYFPDRVVPMLPLRLSADLCSLKPNKDRAAVVLAMHINAQGQVQHLQVHRALVCVAQSLTYEDAHNAQGLDDLHAVNALLNIERAQRAPLEIDVPEQVIYTNAAGEVTHLGLRQRLDSHTLIENCMIAANAAVAHKLAEAATLAPFRVHDEPEPMRHRTLRQTILKAGFDWPTKKNMTLTAPLLNNVLRQANNTPLAGLVHQSVLRTMAQACYSLKNIGHFGLGLSEYTHFTSPIRRYADVLVHRALLHVCGLAEAAPFEKSLLQHINTAERRAADAERLCRERYTASYYSTQVGQTFNATISHVKPTGLIVRLHQTGAEGLVPVSALNGYFKYTDAKPHELYDAQNAVRYTLGDGVEVRLTTVTPLSGGMRFEILSNALPRPVRTPKTKEKVKRKKEKRTKVKANAVKKS